MNTRGRRRQRRLTRRDVEQVVGSTDTPIAIGSKPKEKTATLCSTAIPPADAGGHEPANTMSSAIVYKSPRPLPPSPASEAGALDPRGTAEPLHQSDEGADQPDREHGEVRGRPGARGVATRHPTVPEFANSSPRPRTPPASDDADETTTGSPRGSARTSPRREGRCRPGTGAAGTSRAGRRSVPHRGEDTAMRPSERPDAAHGRAYARRREEATKPIATPIPSMSQLRELSGRRVPIR